MRGHTPESGDKSYVGSSSLGAALMERSRLAPIVAHAQALRAGTQPETDGTQADAALNKGMRMKCMKPLPLGR
ncbi:hypothetical protein HMPREF2978_03550 [Corynebacterium sp. HMSC074C01]|nr:hypothetical protein HMPREF2978_03550 [Corynebacterium sp. HMSC074C01]